MVPLTTARPADAGADTAEAAARSVVGGSPTGTLRDRTALLVPFAVPALAMLVVGRFGMLRPTLGWDENATLDVSRRTVGQILRLAQDTDAVVLPYYLFMHAWTRIFGDSDLALRVPSLITVAIGVGLVGELGRRLFTPGIGCTGALLLVGVPQVSRYAQDARAYGFAFLFAVLATVLLYAALQRPTWRRWAGYGAAVALLGFAHILGLLVLAGHAFAVLTRWRAGHGRALLRWLPVTTAALLPVTPLVVMGLRQRADQLSWIAPVTWKTLTAAPADVFGTTAGLLAVGLAVVVRWHDARLVREFAVLAAAPPVVLIVASLAGAPLWVPRYVLYVLAPLCLLAATTLRGLRGVRAAMVVVLLAAGSAPAHAAVRGPASHHGPDFREVTGIIAAHQRPGDGIVYGAVGNWSLRIGVERHLTGQPAPRDLLLQVPAAQAGQLAAVECPDVRACIGETQRIWLVRLWRHTDPLAGTGAIEPVLRADYRPVRVWRIAKGTVALFERES